MLKRIGFFTSAFLCLSTATVNANDDDDAASAADFTFEHVSCSGHENEIRIIVNDVKGAHGLITADLYPNEEDGFLRGRGRILQVRFAAKAPQTKFCIRAPESGLFAMSVYHDENANGDFDKNGIGLPAEPWGISNNPKVRFGPPKVEKALFEVGAETGAKVSINLN
ncbi:DUF2141 domain-containing protein [Hyphococcus flavus]|uniref:DUF2141 domain-containing protein n=1 Tax=Hyphococcus flavus TaxID=1866326 RepID=A0AAE9ZK91_9PROT|nr:DUF2141 domain-containing protein [Hyphococcus flavus]WDI32706.1 DUF2141 domain-containing protein [Hyphococcus flavus]